MVKTGQDLALLKGAPACKKYTTTGRGNCEKYKLQMLRRGVVSITYYILGFNARILGFPFPASVHAPYPVFQSCPKTGSDETRWDRS